MQDSNHDRLPRAERKHVAHFERLLVAITAEVAGHAFSKDGLDVGIGRSRAGRHLFPRAIRRGRLLRKPGACRQLQPVD